MPFVLVIPLHICPYRSGTRWSRAVSISIFQNRTHLILGSEALGPGDGWEPVHLPGRAACQVQLYRITSHSKIPRDVPHDVIYIALSDTREKQMANTYEKTRKLPFPRGTEQGLKGAGKLFTESLLAYVLKVTRIRYPAAGILCPFTRHVGQRQGRG